MKTSSVLILLFVFLSINLLSQTATWEKTFGYHAADERLFALKTDADGNIMFTGLLDTVIFNPGGIERKAITILMDPDGNTKWMRSVGGDFHAGAVSKSIALPDDNTGMVITGNYIRTNSFWGPYYTSLLLRKYNLTGDVLWHKIYYDADHRYSGESISKTEDGGFMISGICDTCLYLMKTDDYGDSLWTKTYCNFKVNYPDFTGPASKIIQTSDQGYILCHTSLDLPGERMHIIKFNESGDTVWTRTINNDDYSYGSSIIKTSDGNYLACGSQGMSDNGTNDAMIVKIDPGGEVIWEREYDRFGFNDGFSSINETAPDEYVAAGYAYDEPSGGNRIFAYVVKINATGDTLWTRVDNPGVGNISETIQDLDVSPEPGIVLGGNMDNTFFLAKLDEYGIGFTGMENQEIQTDRNIQILVHNNEITIENRAPANGPMLTVLIFNTLGQLVFSGTANADGVTFVNIGQLQPGIYIIKVSDANNCRKVKFSKG
ncbi:MAG: T9SS type A sorting domain-containing protein [Bacteroidales bacterium]|nr:T9SS type A sorting domain-containing protein [Bacteroidales bacterium]MBK9356943.1 T9SS type A sorting domain-containing protein [Bacteroidales bacterium]